MDAPDKTRTHADPVSPITYEAWAARIQMASGVDHLVRIIREYLSAWSPHQLAPLPVEVGAKALYNPMDIAVRAVLATRADLMWKGDQATGRLLREMGLTMRAAAGRLRFLTTVANRGS